MRSLNIAPLLLTCLAVCASAQTFGEITGEVRDSSGGVVVGATVTVTNKATRASRSAQTNEAGVYSVRLIQGARRASARAIVLR